jgi:murein DD-endopeptidase MepM/ murein hydrolase activator NlpD
MPSENTQHRTGRERTTFILVPGGESRQTRSISISRAGIVGAVLFAVLLVVGLTLFVVVYTPVGTVLPIPNPELENKYGRRIVEIQEQLRSLTAEMVVIQEYNLRLRKVLGENVTSAESSYRALGSVGALKPLAQISRDSLANMEGFVRRQDATVSNQSLSTLNGGASPAHVRQAELKSADNFPLTLPTLGYFTREYSTVLGHLGVDIAGKEGSPVVAAAAGKVVFADWTYDYGYQMIVAHGEGYMTVYKHNQALLKTVGSVVKRGEMIALLGNTGWTSRGPHLHFEVWQDGTALDPNNYLITSQ